MLKNWSFGQRLFLCVKTSLALKIKKLDSLNFLVYFNFLILFSILNLTNYPIFFDLNNFLIWLLILLFSTSLLLTTSFDIY